MPVPGAKPERPPNERTPDVTKARVAMIRLAGFTAVLVLLCISASTACGGDNHSGKTPTTPALEGGPTPTASPGRGARNTGIAQLDAVIQAVEEHNVEALRNLIQLQTRACAPPQGAGGPPQCKDGETEGTSVEVFPFIACEPEWLRETEIDGVLAEVLAHPFERFAAFEIDQRFVAVFQATDQPVVGAGVAMVIEDGRIVELRRTCGAGDTAKALIPAGQTDFILPP